MTFLISEDKALRKRLEGMVVHDQRADGDEVPRQVGVWFGQPDQELRPQNYPYITIDMIDMQRDQQREMRGVTNAEYLRPSYLAADAEFDTTLPIPVNIDYQITTYARHPRHDREILAQLMVNRLPRFGYLEIVERTDVNGDTSNVISTYRRLDVINVAKRDVTEQAKRLFVNAITVRVSSEMPQGVFRTLTQVLEVHVDTPAQLPAGMDSLGNFTISNNP